MKIWLCIIILKFTIVIVYTQDSVDQLSLNNQINIQLKSTFISTTLTTFDSIFFRKSNLFDTSLAIKTKTISLSLYENWITALSYYQQKNNFQAIPLLNKILNQKNSYYKNPEILTLFEQSSILLIDCYLKIKDIKNAQNTITKIKRGIDFELTEYIKLQESKIDILKGKNFKASLDLIKNLKHSKSSYINNSSEELLFEIINKNGLTTNQLQSLIDLLYFNEDLMNKSLLSLAKQQLKEQKYQSTQVSYQTWLSLFPQDPLQKTIQKDLEKIIDKQDSENTILIMLPLSQREKNLGTTAFKGIKLRLEQEKNPPLIKLIDTKSDPIRAVQILRKEKLRSKIIGIIGPILSVVSTAVAIELSNTNIPIISPTANKNGLTSLGNNIFQINTNPKVLGEAIVNYATQCLNIKKFAVLAPNSNYGQSMTEIFQETLENNNIELFTSQYYNPNKNNYSEPIQALKASFSQDIIQEKINQKNIFYLRDPLSKHVQEWVQDSIIEIEGLFIVTNNSKDAVNIYSQLQYHKIKTTVLGTLNWNTKISKFSKLNKKNANSIFFSTDFYNYKQTPHWKLFSKNYKNRWKSSPSKVSVLAYEATDLLLLSQDSKTHKTLQNLHSIREFNSIRGLLKINPETHTQDSHIILNWKSSILKPAPICNNL